MSQPDSGEALSADEALRAFTVGAAYASFRERDSGQFAPQMRADFAVFQADPRARRDAACVLTVLDGEPVR